MDTPNRMDPNTLAHQGTYFMSLVNYFSNVDLSHLDSNEDYIYFNIPFFKLVTYPFSWIIPMLLLSTLLFTVLLIYGIRKKKLQWTSIGKGFIVFLSMLLIGGLLGYYGWKNTSIHLSINTMTSFMDLHTTDMNTSFHFSYLLLHYASMDIIKQRQSALLI